MSYSISYYNGGVYPMPQTAIVCATEAIKLLLMVVMATTNGVWREISPSAYFAVPSVVYAITNNLYFFALHYTTPPVWSVLIQSRVIITALVYRFWFKREVTNVQWVALVMLLVAIAMSQVSGKSSSPESMNLLLVAMALSLIQACLSVIASVYTEYLFKTDKRSFVEQQLQMYFFSTLIGLGFFFMQQYSATSNTTDMKDVQYPFGIKICLVVALLLASLGGITVATIVKKLDNI
ncbi:PREDICTED: CMP-sialic acid transporter 1-like [Priapulus caudatus]|uniref:CMP-sialic acid transporter 1-like n=1 Tax=Priapulus caudatus TaxID=37621 RepID=A0ABM1F3E1_PRICU|nr:PREDICTED: CMP-sialic acid transporter 1-like [Priapulus caudatus]